MSKTSVRLGFGFGLMALVGVPAAPTAQAEATLSVREERPWALLPELGLAPAPTNPLPGYAIWGFTVQRSLPQALVLDLRLGGGLSSVAVARNADGSQRDVSMAVGTHAGVLLRRLFFVDAQRRGAFSVGLGPGLFTGGAFDTVALARAEVGFEWCFKWGLTLFAGLGYDLALSESKQPIAANDCLTGDCPTYFKAGRGQISTRYGIGYSF